MDKETTLSQREDIIEREEAWLYYLEYEREEQSSESIKEIETTKERIKELKSLNEQNE